MNELPRFALGTIQADVPIQPLLIALLERFRRERLASQVYLSRAQFLANDLFRPLTGRCVRHLDSWLMTAKTCRQSLRLGSQTADLSLVLGTYTAPNARHAVAAGGTLDALADWLELPRIVVLNVSRLVDCDGTNLSLPAQTAGLLLDGVLTEQAYGTWRQRLEQEVGVPVLGGLCGGLVPSLSHGAWARCPPKREVIRRLADDLSRRFDLDRLIDLARQHPWPRMCNGAASRYRRCRGPRVAIALDKAFHAYYPDMLDLLEMQGATLCVFSPLKAERLPPFTDLVLLGGGAPQRYAERLAANVCLKQSLREHVRAGGRVYAEGGGLAFVCQALQVDGRRFPMAGLLPAIAMYEPQASRPVELRLIRASWLGGGQTILRGYRNSDWLLQTAGPLVNLADDPQHQLDLVRFRQVIGSRVHLHFSAQPALLRNLLAPWAVKAR